MKATNMSFLNNILTSIKASASASSGVVGIDIGSSSIKVVELEERKGVITLVTYGEVQLGPYAGKQIGESVTLDPKQEQEALVDVIRESGVKARDAVFAMPLSSSFVTNVDIDSGEDADMSAMVRVEARKVIPASLSEVTLDWAEVELTKKESANNQPGHHNVLIAAIQNAALERFKVLMQFAGLSKPPTEIECFSTIRGLYKSTEPDIAILDIGASSSKMYMVHKGLLMRMYRIRAGGEIATKKISETLDIDFLEAEEMKLVADAESATFSDLKRAHNVSYERPLHEFGQVMREYEKKTALNISTVYLAGGACLFPGMMQHIKSSLDREVIIADPFSKVAYPSFMEDIMEEIGPSFSVAVGAAMRAFE
jgi:type IV pilus assembly protein PilM